MFHNTLHRSELVYLLIVFISILILHSNRVEAYYDDMHYDFTYYLARSVGYTPEQAYRIASADLSIDYDPDTEPVQQTAQLKMWAAAAAYHVRDPSGKLWTKERKSYVSIPSIPRIKFHAMMDCFNWEKCHSDPLHRKKAEAVIPIFQEKLWQGSLINGNLGAYLHFIEDKPSHDGYPSDNGHWTAVDMWLNNGALRMGSGTDYIDYDGNDGKRDTRRMLANVLKQMSIYMTTAIPKQRLLAPKLVFSEASVQLENKIENIYQELRRINPIDQAPGFQEASRRTLKKAPKPMPFEPFSAYMGRFLATATPEMWNTFKAGAEPSREQAYSTISNGLKKELNSLITTYPFERIKYELDDNGDPVGQYMIDQWVLFGDLLVDTIFLKDGKNVRPSKFVEIKIFSAPTFKGEKPYLLDKSSSSEQTLFENLPVGDLKIEVYSDGKLLNETAFKLQAQNAYLAIKINHDDLNTQIELNEHLERMQFLMREITKHQREYKQLDRETKTLINALKTTIDDLGKSTSSQGEAEQLLKQAEQQKEWNKQIEQTSRLLEKFARYTRSQNKRICSSNESPSISGKEQISILKQEKVLENFESSLLKAKDTLATYEDFLFRLDTFKKSTPDKILDLLREQFNKSEDKLDKMVELIRDVNSEKEEINDIYEVANRIVEKELDQIKDRKGEKLPSATHNFYNDLLTPFFDLYSQSQTILLKREHIQKYRNKLEKIIANQDQVDAIREEHKKYYRRIQGLKLNKTSYVAMREQVTQIEIKLHKAQANVSNTRRCFAEKETTESGLFEPSVGFIIVRVEGDGYIPAYGGITNVVKGYGDVLITIKKGENPREVVRKYYEKLRKGTSCKNFDTWAGISGLGKPMFWTHGPEVRVVHKGPFSRRDSRKDMGLEAAWRFQKDVKTPSWSDLRRKACGAKQ